MLHQRLEMKNHFYVNAWIEKIINILLLVRCEPKTEEVGLTRSFRSTCAIGVTIRRGHHPLFVRVRPSASFQSSNKKKHPNGWFFHLWKTWDGLRTFPWREFGCALGE